MLSILYFYTEVMYSLVRKDRDLLPFIIYALYYSAIGAHDRNQFGKPSAYSSYWRTDWFIHQV
jgi:hypothetical protein